MVNKTSRINKNALQLCKLSFVNAQLTEASWFDGKMKADHYFPAEWEFDCSISQHLFPFHNILIPHLNALWQIGSSERTLVCQYKLVQHTKLLRNSNREHFNLEQWHSHLGFYHFWVRLVCILGKSQAHSQSAPCHVQHFDKTVLPKRFTGNIWNMNQALLRKNVLRDSVLCVRQTWRLSGWETDDCLWDGKGMRNHYWPNFFSLHVLN